MRSLERDPTSLHKVQSPQVPHEAAVQDSLSLTSPEQLMPLAVGGGLSQVRDLSRDPVHIVHSLHVDQSPLVQEVCSESSPIHEPARKTKHGAFQYR